MDISVDRDAEIPIGVQLAWALRTRIRDGRFQPGQRLPGLREVAEATGVNVNTARTVYQRLEQEGLIDSQQGSGTFVAATPQQRATVTAIAADAAREAHATGVDPREVAAALYVSPDRRLAGRRRCEPPRPAPADDAAERRRALRAQIASLERTLGEIEAKHPGVAPPREVARAGSGPALLDADALEQVRTMLVRRLAAVQAAIDAHRQRRRQRRARGRRGARAARQAREPQAREPTGAARARTYAPSSGRRLTAAPLEAIVQLYFLSMVLGFPLVILALALLAGHLNRDGYAELLDWKPTRSPELEVELELGDIEQMLAAQNRHRRRRGAPERTLAQVSERARAGFTPRG